MERVFLSWAKAKENVILFIFPKEFKKIAEILINDEKFKEDDWCDLTKECANQIIGYAKIC